jgi:hypothetical protein
MMKSGMSSRYLKCPAQTNEAREGNPLASSTRSQGSNAITPGDAHDSMKRTALRPGLSSILFESERVLAHRQQDQADVGERR